MALTNAERDTVGTVVHYWPDAAAVAANRPLLFLVQRSVIGAQTTVHGRTLAHLPIGDRVYGDPAEQGSLPHGLSAIVLGVAPAAGTATVRPDADILDRIEELEEASDANGALAYGTVSSHPASGSFLSVGLSSSWATLTGGALSGDSSGVSYNSVTGEVTLSAAGVYALGFSVSQGRVIGITTPTATAAIWTASAATEISGRHRLGVLNDMAAVASSGILRVSDNAVIRLRLLSSGDTTVDVADWSLTATWIAP